MTPHCCLTGESEERETWTAESLRAARHGRDGCASSDPYCGVRLDETSAVHVLVNTKLCLVPPLRGEPERRVVGPRQTL